MQQQAQCRGCGETRLVRWWQAHDRDGYVSEVKYCDTCGAMAENGEADAVEYAEPMEDYAAPGSFLPYSVLRGYAGKVVSIRRQYGRISGTLETVEGAGSYLNVTGTLRDEYGVGSVDLSEVTHITITTED